MRSCGNRTYVFARRIIAMLAKHWLENGLNTFRIVVVTGEISINPQPVHVVKTHYLFLTHHRNIILDMTGSHAGMTTYAGVQVDGHTPFDSGLFMIWVQSR